MNGPIQNSKWRIQFEIPNGKSHSKFRMENPIKIPNGESHSKFRMENPIRNSEWRIQFENPNGESNSKFQLENPIQNSNWKIQFEIPIGESNSKFQMENEMKEVRDAYWSARPLTTGRSGCLASSSSLVTLIDVSLNVIPPTNTCKTKKKNRIWKCLPAIIQWNCFFLPFLFGWFGEEEKSALI